MGVVYKARHLRLNRIVAVKMLLAGAHTDRAGLKRLLREAEAVAALRPPNLVHVHEVGDDNGLPYFTMELVEGGSLREKLADGVLGAHEAASLVSTLADAMEVAHASGIVHRDLEPANVLLTPEGVPKIADFGLARRIEGESSLTLTDARQGTPSDMAPEQVQGEARSIGPASDVYALGAILDATLTGHPPFRSDVCAVTLLQVIQAEPVRPSRLNPRVPLDLETICLKRLSKQPLQRHASASALAADLQRFLRAEPILARPVGALERTRKWVRRRLAHAIIVAGTVLAVLSLVGAGLWVGIQRGAIERAADGDLLELDRAAAAEDWTGARTALESARARPMGGGFASASARVEQSARELALVGRLDGIRERVAGPHPSPTSMFKGLPSQWRVGPGQSPATRCCASNAPVRQGVRRSQGPGPCLALHRDRSAQRRARRRCRRIRTLRPASARGLEEGPVPRRGARRLTCRGTTGLGAGAVAQAVERCGLADGTREVGARRRACPTTG